MGIVIKPNQDFISGTDKDKNVIGLQPAHNTGQTQVDSPWNRRLSNIKNFFTPVWKKLTLILVLTLSTFGGVILFANQQYDGTAKNSKAIGTAYYVDATNGNDANAGTATLPLLTIEKGLSLVNPGDTLYLKSGTYLRTSMLSITKTGSADAPITISTAPGEPSYAVISGDVNNNSIVDETDGPRTADPITYHKYYPLVRLRGSYLIFKNIEIKYSGGRGLQNEATNALISNVNVHHTWNSAIHVFGNNSIVENSRIWRGAESNYCGGVGGARACNGDWPGGLAWGDASGSTAPGSATNIIVRGNSVYNNSGEGMLCMHTDNNLIENNIVYDNWGLGIDLDKCAYATVRNNLVYYTSDTSWWRVTDSSGNVIRPHTGILISNEHTTDAGDPYPLGHDRKIFNNIIVGAGRGITFWPGDGTGGEFEYSRLINDVIANNTFVEMQNSGTGIKINKPPTEGLGHTNTRIANNIVLQTLGSLTDIDITTGLTFDHNLWSKTPAVAVAGEGDIVGSSLLVDPNHSRLPGEVLAGWYELTSLSPAIDAAANLTPIGVVEDYSKTARPQGSVFDIGAYEFPVVIPTPAPTPTPTPSYHYTLYEAESAVRSGVAISAKHPGYSSSGFVDYIHNSNDYTEWTINVPSSGKYYLTFRYGNGSTTNRTLQIKANGTIVKSALDFKPTGSWNTWGTTILPVTLNAGSNTIRATAMGYNGSNVDSLAVSN